MVILLKDQQWIRSIQGRLIKQCSFALLQASLNFVRLKLSLENRGLKQSVYARLCLKFFLLVQMALYYGLYLTWVIFKSLNNFVRYSLVFHWVMPLAWMGNCISLRTVAEYHSLIRQVKVFGRHDIASDRGFDSVFESHWQDFSTWIFYSIIGRIETFS